MSQSKRIRIWCTYNAPGIHYWPKPPEASAYLRASHRHNFHFRVETYIENSRDLDFITLQRRVRVVLAQTYRDHYPQDLQLHSASCEDIAAVLWKKLTEDYELDLHSITVSEDGENGATLEAEA